MDYKQKYLKYKSKYLKYQNSLKGGTFISQHKLRALLGLSEMIPGSIQGMLDNDFLNSIGYTQTTSPDDRLSIDELIALIEEGTIGAGKENYMINLEKIPLNITSRGLIFVETPYLPRKHPSQINIDPLIFSLPYRGLLRDKYLFSQDAIQFVKHMNKAYPGLKLQNPGEIWKGYTAWPGFAPQQDVQQDVLQDMTFESPFGEQLPIPFGAQQSYTPQGAAAPQQGAAAAVQPALTFPSPYGEILHKPWGTW